MRLYRLLLFLYPSAFRAEYEDELCRIFTQERRSVSGAFSGLLFWMHQIVDIFRNAVIVHWDILRNDLRYCLKAVARRPGFAVTAILVTALGIGANTAVFSVVNHVLIRPLPYKEFDRIIRLYESTPRGYNEASPLNFRDWKQRSRSFSEMAAYSNTSVNLVGKGIPERINGAVVTADLFPLLGVNPLLGRTISAKDDVDGAPGVVVISYGLWQSRFGGDVRTVGQSITLDEELVTIVGIMPQQFTFPDRETSLWIPIRFDVNSEGFADRDNNYLYVIGRLRKGITLDEANAEMESIARVLEQEHPLENAKTRIIMFRLRDLVSKQSRLLLAALLGASVCVLLIACTNLANLFLVRAMGRRRELIVRAALGAGRERLVRQLFTESLLFAVAGGIAGIFLAYWSVPLLEHLIPSSLPAGDATILDIRVLVFAIVILLITAVSFGVVPALRISGSADAGALREGPRTVIGDQRERFRSILVIAEISATVILLICSSLLIRALWKIQSVDPGFNVENIWTLQTPLPLPRYEPTMRRADFYKRVLEEVRRLPDVRNAAYITGLPMVMRGGIWPILKPGGVNPTPGDSKTVSLRFATPGYFDALQIPIKVGRDLSDADTSEAPSVAVVSESFIREHFGSEDPIGRRFHVAFQDRMIVGVVGDVRTRGLERSSEPQVYLPYQQVPDGALTYYAPKTLVIRMTGEFNPIEAVRRIIHKVDPEIPVSDIQTLRDVVNGETDSRTIQIRVISAFALLSMLLACVGIHGLLAFSVSQRVSEIGLRMALGAQSNDVLKLVLGRAVIVAIAGSMIGLIAGYGAARAMQALLAGIPPGDWRAFLVAAAFAAMMTVSGSIIPAWRALRVDPANVLRNE